MSRPDLLTNIKFRRLLKATGLPRPLLVGHLEMLWTTAHVSKPVFLDADDVELAADWDGEPGQFAAHLIKYGFLDETEDGLAIHDYWDHAPEYVKRRERRRRKKEAMSTLDRPVIEIAPETQIVNRRDRMADKPTIQAAMSSKAQPANQTHTASMPVRDTSVAVREPSDPPSTDASLPKAAPHNGTIAPPGNIMSRRDRPVTDTTSSKLPPANQTHTASVTVRDTSVAVREPSDPPSTDACKTPEPDLTTQDKRSKSDTPPPRTAEEFLAKIGNLTDDPAWHTWWRNLMALLTPKGADLAELWNAMDYVTARTDLAQCAAANQSPMKHPMSRLSREAIRLCHKYSVPWPRVPKQSG